MESGNWQSSSSKQRPENRERGHHDDHSNKYDESKGYRKRHIYGMEGTYSREHKRIKVASVNDEDATKECLKNNYNLIRYISHTPGYFQIFIQEVIDIMKKHKSSNNVELEKASLYEIQQHRERISNKIENNLKYLHKILNDDNKNIHSKTGKNIEKDIINLLTDEDKTLRQAAQDSLPILDELINEVTTIQSLDTEKLQYSRKVRRALTYALKSVSDRPQTTSETPYSYDDINTELSDKYTYKLEHLETIRKKIVDAIKEAVNSDDAENLRKWENHITNITYSRLLDLEDNIKRKFTTIERNMNSRAVIYKDSNRKVKIMTELYFPKLENPFNATNKIWKEIAHNFAGSNITELPQYQRSRDTYRTQYDAEIKTLCELDKKLNKKLEELKEEGTKIENITIDLLQTKGPCTACNHRVRKFTEKWTKKFVGSGYVGKLTLKVYYNDHPSYKVIDARDNKPPYTIKYGNKPFAIKISKECTIYLQDYTLPDAKQRGFLTADHAHDKSAGPPERPSSSRHKRGFDSDTPYQQSPRKRQRHSEAADRPSSSKPPHRSPTDDRTDSRRRVNPSHDVSRHKNAYNRSKDRKRR